MRRTGGFSLIEVVVSITIVALMLGVGIPAFRSYGRLAAFRQAAADIQLAILQAHNLALAPEVEKPANHNYYGVQFLPDGRYQVMRCEESQASSNRCASGSEQTVAQYRLEAGISFAGVQPSYLGYRVATGGKPVVSTTANVITIHSDFVPIDDLATIRLTVNPVTGQVSTE